MKKAIQILVILFLFQFYSYAQRIVREDCIGTSRDEKIIDIHENDDQTTNVIFKTIIIDSITFNNKESIHLIKLNSNKEIILTKKMDSINENGLLTGTIFFDSNGSFLLTYNYYDTSLAVLQMEVNKYDADGNFSWKNNISNNFYSENPNIKRTNTGGYVFTPSTNYMDNNKIICINHLGQLIWEKAISFNDLIINPRFTSFSISAFPLKNQNTIIQRSISSQGMFLDYDTTINIIELIDITGNTIKSDTIGTKFPRFTSIYNHETVDFYFSYDYYFSGIRTTYNSTNLSIQRIDSINTYNYFSLTNIYNTSNILTDTSNIFNFNVFQDSFITCLTLQNNLLWRYPYPKKDAFTSNPYLNATQYLITDNYSIIMDSIFISNGIKKWKTNADLRDTIFYLNKQWYAISKTIHKNKNNVYYYLNNYIDTICSFCPPETKQNILVVIQAFDINTGLVNEKMMFIPKTDEIFEARYFDMNKASVIGNTRDVCRYGLSDIYLATYSNQFNTLKGIAYIDYNNNNTKDNNEPIYPYGYITTTSISDTQTQHLNAAFPFVFFTDSSSYITKLNLYNNYYNSTPSQFVTSHNTFDNIDTLLFALHPVSNKNDIAIALVNNWMTRLGQENNYTISLENKGTTYGNGKVKVLMDSRLLNISTTPNFSFRNGDTLVWNITNQLPTQILFSTIHFTAETPSVLNSGDTLTSKAWFESDSIDLTPDDNSAEAKEIIRASYDPNEKNIISGETLTPTQIDNGAYISYIIHFENKGNDTAFKVIVIDTLSEKVDIKLLQIINASHPYTLEILGGKVLKFTFNNIGLSYDSTSTSSKGYIAYKIKARTDVAVGNTIDNTANIFFDYNQPIRTNTAQAKILIATTTKQNKANNGKMNIYPNPNNGIFTISFESKNNASIQLELLDATGNIIYQENKVHQTKTTFTINQTNLAKGIYWIKLSDGKEVFSNAIIVQ